MKARDIIGKTVASVDQHRIDEQGRIYWCLDAIRFTDGTILHLSGSDLMVENTVRAVVYKPSRRACRGPIRED